MNIESKLPQAGTTIFTVMSSLAREQNAINLSQGFPDFGCSAELTELAGKYIRDGFNQYAPMPGTTALRERVAEIINQTYSTSYNVETEITITAGATQAIYTAIACLVRPGDEVIVLEPAYDCYIPAILVHGGKPIVCTMKEPLFQVDWEEVKSKISPKTKAIIINSPHNPTGTIFSREDMLTLEKLVEGKNIVVISDEVYEHMVFDGNQHHSACTFPSLKEQSILVSSFGKTIHTTGWKIGYVAAPEKIMQEFRKVHQFLVFVVNHPLQLAVAEFLSDSKNYLGVKDFYEEKRNYFRKLLSGSRFNLLPCQGTYFQLLSYEKISELEDTELAVKFTREHKIASIPLSAFYSGKTVPKKLRFCFAKKNETLEKAAAILSSL